jgi:Uma2 family endonuclease
MSTKTLMTVEEYLRTSFEDGDCEYVDGEIVEKNMGSLGHGMVQKRLIVFLGALESIVGLQVGPEIRIRISSSRYRVPDISVWLSGDIGAEIGLDIPTVPPFLIIEVLSPDDRMPRVKIKLEEYLSIGVQWVWLVDPKDRQAICYSQANPAGSVCDLLRTENPRIEIPLEKVLG